jgi:hypothetical protein
MFLAMLLELQLRPELKNTVPKPQVMQQEYKVPNKYMHVQVDGQRARVPGSIGFMWSHSED